LLKHKDGARGKSPKVAIMLKANVNLKRKSSDILTRFKKYHLINVSFLDYQLENP